MFEVALTTLFIAVAVVAVGHRRQRPLLQAQPDTLTVSDDDVATDLPCPWCLAQTREDDRHCPECGQLFG